MAGIEHLDELMQGIYQIEDAFGDIGVAVEDRRACATVLMGLRQSASRYSDDVLKEFTVKDLARGHEVMARDQLSKTALLSGEVMESAVRWCAREATDAFLRSRVRKGHRIVRDDLDNFPGGTPVRHQMLNPQQEWEDLDRTVMDLRRSDSSMMMRAWDRFPAAFCPTP